MNRLAHKKFPPPRLHRGDVSADRPGMRYLTRQTYRGRFREVWLSEKAFAAATARRDEDRARRLSTPRGHAAQLASNATSRSIEFRVPCAERAALIALIEAQMKFQRGRCAASAREFGRGRCSMTVDRIVPAFGYVAGNIRLVCKFVNCSKRDKVTSASIRRVRSNRLTDSERNAVADYVAREVPAALYAAATAVLRVWNRASAAPATCAIV